MLKEFKVYYKSIRIYLLSGLEYRGWWMVVLSVAIGLIMDQADVVLMFSRFGGIGEWSFERIWFIYILASTSYGLAKIFCVGFEDFPWQMIQSGDFDRFLLRPRSLFTQISGSNFRLGRVPWAVLGIIGLIWLLSLLNVPLNFINSIVLIFALIGGFLTYIGVFILTSGLAFFTIKGLDWIYIFSNNRQLTKCPIDYIPKALRNIFTFIMPMLVISYYPASLICGWGEPAFTGFLALPVGIVFLCISLLIWKIGVRHYKSTGS